MDYSKICKVYQDLELTTKGLEKTKILSDFLSEIKDEPESIYLLKGEVFADYDSKELGISNQLAIRSISKAAGISDSQVVKEFKSLGDLGNVAELVIKKKKQQTSLFSKKLSVEKVIKNLQKLPTLAGKGTVNLKINLIIGLLNSSKPKEAKYIIRTVLRDLKIGVGAGMLRDAIADNCFKPKNLEEKKTYSSKIQEAYDKSADFAEVFKKSCKNKLSDIRLSPGKPVKVMLFPKAKNIIKAFEIIGKPAAFEYKYDGFRVMINKEKTGKIKIFTRRLENVTNQFPEIIDYIKTYIKGKTFIIDAEAVGFDSKSKEYSSFQEISQRIRRIYGVEQMAKKLPIELVIFDIIYFEDKNLIEEPFEKRRKLLKKIVNQKPFKIVLAKQIITDKESTVEEFYKKAIKENQEGLMGKNLKAPYKPGSRIGYGVKLKPEDNDLDLVITGAEWGTGKRAGWLTSFEISCMDENNLLDIGKVSTGLKELEEVGLSFKEMTKKLKRLIIKETGRKIKVKPKIVITVQYQNIQKSPNYSSGYALRFPRIKRLRPDRGMGDIATLKEIIKEAK